MRSARSSILGWVMLPLLLALVATYFVSGVLLKNSLASQIDEQLSQEAQELSLLADRAINPETGEKYDSARELLDLYIRRSVPSNTETIFVMVDGSVTQRSSGPGLPRLDQVDGFVESIAKLDEPVLETYGTGSAEVRFVAIPVNGATDSGHLVAAIYLEKALAVVNSTLTQLAILFSMAFLLALALGWLVAGRILLPIRQLSKMTRGISDATTEERLPVSGQNSEIGSIVEDFNGMLDRTSSAFASQRRFVDDAGHELKTPLTIIRGHLDLVRNSPNETKASMAIIEDEVLRMTRIVKDLQTLTKSNQPSFIQTASLEPSEIVDEVFVKSTPLAIRKWSIIAPDIGPASLDRQRMVQALIQLVDNSIKHTVESDSIVIGCRLNKNEIEFFVGDSGPGIPLEARGEVQERFVRGGWTSQDSEGSGLGLTIVSAIAKGHQGSVFIGDSILGGAEVGITVPWTRDIEEGGES